MRVSVHESVCVRVRVRVRGRTRGTDGLWKNGIHHSQTDGHKHKKTTSHTNKLAN